MGAAENGLETCRARTAPPCRHAQALLERLAALNAPLQRLLPSSQAAVLQLSAACGMVASCASLAEALGQPSEALTERLGQACIRLPLQCGRLALKAAGALAPGQALPQKAEKLLTCQVEAVNFLLPNCRRSAAAPAAEGSLAAAWLQAAAAAMAHLRPAIRHIVLKDFSSICGQAIFLPKLAAYRSALEQSPKALDAIVNLLLLNLPALAPPLLEQQAGNTEQIGWPGPRGCPTRARHAHY